MKTKQSIRLLAVAVLASTLLLGACGNKKEEAKNDNANKTTQTTSSSKASSSNKDSKSQTSTSTTTSEKAVASTEQASSPTTQGQESDQAAQTPQAPQQQETPANKRYKGVLTMVDGDFSAAAGSWKGANGETITVSPSGQFTVETADGNKENYSIRGYAYTLDDGKYNAKIGGGKVIQITTGADGTVTSVVLIQP